ncbi:MAG: hypothetical protein KA165_04925 [Saprospiraceae bacterium]|nr:hypothetical protein [Saprospiraceae bacterium]
MKSSIEKIKIEYQGKEVFARKLTVASQIPTNIEMAWSNVLTSALLEFVAKGKIRFMPSNGKFPLVWKERETVTTRMLFFGFVPFGGLHTIYFEKIDAQNKLLQTKEWDESAKVWNHRISMRKIDEQVIWYEDEITIYGGILTRLVVWWASVFYKHRQKRWQILAAGKFKQIGFDGTFNT